MKLEALATDPAVARARRILHETDDETLADLVELVQIPAPPFHEDARGERVAQRFREVGLIDVVRDDVGNVLARLPTTPAGDPRGPDAHRPVLVSAHLDTIFPEGTDVAVRREGDRLVAPGIADDGRGLAALLAIARALVRAGVRTRRPLVFVATVGEEGMGDLRGAKHLFRDGSPWRRAAGFISLEGAGRRRIVHRALGARRLRVTLAGPGGHSWVDRGAPSPIDALALALAELARSAPPHDQGTALTTGRIGGGTSINAIPADAWAELDLRAESAEALSELEARVAAAFAAATARTNARRRAGTPPLTFVGERIGDRPVGRTPRDSPLVRAARAATRFIGQTPELVVASTDANVPMSLGIPAIAMGAGGDSGGVHTTGEWYTNDAGSEGIERALLTALMATEAE